jgi:hypothetical protein
VRVALCWGLTVMNFNFFFDFNVLLFRSFKLRFTGRYRNTQNDRQ